MKTTILILALLLAGCTTSKEFVITDIIVSGTSNGVYYEEVITLDEPIYTDKKISIYPVYSEAGLNFKPKKKK